MESPDRTRRPRRDPRKVVAAFTAALFASAWLAVAAWGSRHSPTPVGPAKDRKPQTVPSTSYDTQPYGNPQSDPSQAQADPSQSDQSQSQSDNSAPPVQTGQS